MAGGGVVTKEPGTDLFAKRFHDAGFAVLAFDYRHLGESGGQPRQVVRNREQLADWQAAIACARTLPLTGEPGTVALLTTPDARDGGRALDPDGRYPDWQQEIAARSALRLGYLLDRSRTERPGAAALSRPTGGRPA